MSETGCSQEQIYRELASLKQRLESLQQQVGQLSLVDELPSTDFSMLGCRVGEERVGFLLESIHEVVPMAKLSRVPEAPPWVVGLLNLRGTAVPVLDLLSRFGTEHSVGVDDFIVVCGEPGRVVGLVVQEVYEVFAGSPSAIQPLSQDVRCAPYVLGVLCSSAGSMLLVSVKRLVSGVDLLDLRREGIPGAEEPVVEAIELVEGP